MMQCDLILNFENKEKVFLYKDRKSIRKMSVPIIFFFTDCLKTGSTPSSKQRICCAMVNVFYDHPFLNVSIVIRIF